MSFRAHSNPLRALAAAMAGLVASGGLLPVQAWADADTRVLVVPFRAIRDQASGKVASRATDVLADALRTEDGIAVVATLPPAPTARPAPAPAKGPDAAAASAAKKQIDRGIALLRRLKFQPGAEAIEQGIAAYEAAPAAVDVRVLRDAYVQLAVARYRSGDEAGGAHALEAAVRLAPGQGLRGSFPPVFKRAFEQAKRAVLSGPKGSVAVQGEGQVSLDGRELGAAPASASEIVEGDHFVLVRRADGSAWGAKVAVNDGPTSVDIPPASAPTGAPGLASLDDNHIDDEVLGELDSAAQAAGADFVVFGGVYKSGDGLGCAAHLFSVKTHQEVMLTPIHFDADMVSAGIEANKLAGEIASVIPVFSKGEALPAPVAAELEAPAGEAAPVAAAEPKPDAAAAQEGEEPRRPVVVRHEEGQKPPDASAPLLVTKAEPVEPQVRALPRPGQPGPAGQIGAEGGEVERPAASSGSSLWIWGLAAGGAVLTGAAIGAVVVYEHNKAPVTGTATFTFQ